ncbi:MAG: Asp-tRNA(Asn)/Glu-tRNA(Gln) amidotransferase subunit GatA [Candidatus Carbobacillus altaicus]|nr:Asp-tRNA(Asn)/Glu-tRNA(Gln) amidotransferase subunit GatA [Candidatus Carbobacillus altaicus]
MGEALYEKSLLVLRKLLQDGDLTVSEVVQSYLTRVRTVETRVGSFIELAEEEALLQGAKTLDERRSRGEGDISHHPLYGLPVGMKDNIAVRGMRMTNASRMLEHYRSPYDATVTTRLREAEGIIMGKLNMDEFAMGSSTETSALQTTRNPWHTDYVPGGSSGGSAAAVAAGEVAFAFGTDSGGSIRQPAAYTGVVGFKPTYGRISRFGVAAFASSFDTVGFLTRDALDAAFILDIFSGFDEKDTTSLPHEPTNVYHTLKDRDPDTFLKGLRIAVPHEFMGEVISPEVKARIEEAFHVLEQAGAHIEYVHFPHMAYAEPAYYILTSAEASSNMSRFDGVRYGYRAKDVEDIETMFKKTRSEGLGWEVKRRILLGTFSLSAGHYEAFYQKAQKVRTLIHEDFARLFADYDVVLGPTTPTAAFKFGERLSDPLKMYESDLLTVIANLAGLPAISVPAGFTSAGLPVGLQIMGPVLGEEEVLGVAHAYQTLTEHHLARPTL